GPGGGPLYDNTSETSAELTGAPVDLDRAAEAGSYTLTSAQRAAAPSGWTLEGSADGQRWTRLDRREGESFTWDRQTRVFGIARPGRYRHYRLLPDHGGTLAEVELLGSP
ncbi:hypothetical protein ACWDFH_25060, partial [Streptomyces kronopolitis]